MRLWRISNYADLNGTGGLIGSGRWHSRGRRIIYTADSPASALLELLVRFEVPAINVPKDYKLLAVEVPDDVASSAIDDLPIDWRNQTALTRSLGDRWLQASETPLLRVPSAIVPFTTNWLLNPSHPDAERCGIASETLESLDHRLFRLFHAD